MRDVCYDFRVMGLVCLQSVIFHVEKHPHYTWFEQCGTFNFFPSRTWEIAYNLVCTLIMCGLPLVCIIYAYAAILWKINKRLHNDEGQSSYRFATSAHAWTLILSPMAQSAFYVQILHIFILFGTLLMFLKKYLNFNCIQLWVVCYVEM